MQGTPWLSWCPVLGLYLSHCLCILMLEFPFPFSQILGLRVISLHVCLILFLLTVKCFHGFSVLVYMESFLVAQQLGDIASQYLYIFCFFLFLPNESLVWKIVSMWYISTMIFPANGILVVFLLGSTKQLTKTNFWLTVPGYSPSWQRSHGGRNSIQLFIQIYSWETVRVKGLY